MPVRVKSRALALQKPDEIDREWDNLRSSLVSFMLANSQLSKLVISDVERSKRISIRLGTAPEGQASTGEVDLGRIGSILAQSGMAPSRNMDSWHVISAKIPELTIQAAISTVPSPSKRYQFISLVNGPVLWRGNSNILFSEVNRLFSVSDFGNTGVIDRGTPTTCPSPLPDQSAAPGSAGGRSWTKPVNKWPMFYIRVDTGCDQHLYDDGEETSPDSQKSTQRILDVLGAMILEFLKQQNLRPRMKRPKGMSDRSRSTTGVSTNSAESVEHRAKRSKQMSSTEEALSNHVKLPSFQNLQSVNTSPHLNNWSRVKAAKDLSTPPQAGANGRDGSIDNHRGEGRHWSLPERPRKSHEQRVSKHFKSSNAPVHESTSLSRGSEPENEPGHDQCIPWVDPHTGKSHLINSRTGQTLNHPASDGGFRIQSDNFVWASQKLTDLRRSQTAPTSTTTSWVDNILRAWENPTFARTELPVPSVDVGTHLGLAKPSHDCLQTIGSLDATHVAKFRGRLRRHSLATANIIAQVDQKFILAKLDTAPIQASGDSEKALVLIDQHAADERCRVERLFEEMFIHAETSIRTEQVQTTEVDPVVFHASITEASLFQKYRDFFSKWGIHYSMEPRSDSTVAISVQALPTLIAERCRLEPNTVVDLLRREIWTNEEENANPSSSTARKNIAVDFSLLEDESYPETMAAPSSGPHSWVQKMSKCPQGILELLNSRACRGAIMFNDPLSIDECKALVARLSTCAFPFQCAHGRPSMIPILDLRSQIGLEELAPDVETPTSDEDGRTMSFAEAFRARYVH